jgi:diguanylate cyclase (GGDEF)-like protein
MILALIAIVPIVLERVHNEQFDRGERIEAAHKQALGLARQAAASQGDVIVSTRSLLQVLARTGVVANPSDHSCAGLLRSIADSQRWIRTLSVADLSGRIVCSTSGFAVGLDIGKRAHFVDAIATGHFVLSDYFMGTRDKSPLIIAANPQRNAAGQIESVVLATLDLNWIGQIAGAMTVRSGSVMLLFDGEGTVLAREPNPAQWLGRNLKDHPLIKGMTGHAEGVVTDVSLDGVRRIFAFATLPGTRAHVAVGFDEREVLARVDVAMWSAFTELGSVTFLVLLSIWFGAERLLVRPIRLLAETAGRIGRGEEKTNASSLPWASEFIPLAAALDDMSETLDAREQELRDINDQLRELAQLDSLTCLANRRAFNAHLLTEWKYAVARRQPIAVLMIDVDHFKAFNDRYGHVQGDACLRKVGEVLKACTKPRTDSHEKPAVVGRGAQLAARYGGEEFSVLLPAMGLNEAARLAERLRCAVEELLVSHAGAPLGFLSISVGVASVVPGEGDSPQDLTEAADTCLYEAKQRGRNTVVAKSDVMTLLRASA